MLEASTRSGQGNAIFIKEKLRKLKKCKCKFNVKYRECLRVPGDKPLGKEENQQQTQPTYDAGSGNQTRDTLVSCSFIQSVLRNKILFMIYSF